MRPVALRCRPGDDLRGAIEAAVRDHAVEAAFVVSGIGSLRPARLRLAGADEPTVLDGDLQILTLAGSVAANGAHLHASVADATGRVVGGHLASGSIVRTTAEVLICLLPDARFVRAYDPATGHDELTVDRIDRDRG